LLFTSIQSKLSKTDLAIKELSSTNQVSSSITKVNGVNLAGDSPAAVEKRIEIFFQNSLSYGPCVILIESVS
jgi:hypothetical protein